MNLDEFKAWFHEYLGDYTNLVQLLDQVLNIELEKAFGEPGQPGDIALIKYCIDKLSDMSLSLLEWEKEIRVIKPPEEVLEAKEIMKNWSRCLIDELRKFYEKIDDFFYNFVPTEEMQTLQVSIAITAPSTMDQVVDIFRRAYGVDEFDEDSY